MRIVVALGGNALLKRGEPMTAEAQRANVKGGRAGARPIASEHQLVISHGNGPQVGLLALQGAAYSQQGLPVGRAGRRDRRNDRLHDRAGAR